MHELSVAISLVDAVCEELDRLPPSRLRAVHLRLGALSGVAADALTLAFDLAAADTRAAGATLEITSTPGQDLAVAALEIIDDDTADCGSPTECPEKK